mmetsp:Transcript_39487/g.77339  ORF Transcript_39487/g.77339 Transcript_39487/m.77339 type:complete len:336 (-) Transcript_39487:168-1175(-)
MSLGSVFSMNLCFFPDSSASAGIVVCWQMHAGSSQAHGASYHMPVCSSGRLAMTHVSSTHLKSFGSEWAQLRNEFVSRDAQFSSRHPALALFLLLWYSPSHVAGRFPPVAPPRMPERKFESSRVLGVGRLKPKASQVEKHFAKFPRLPVSRYDTPEGAVCAAGSMSSSSLSVSRNQSSASSTPPHSGATSPSSSWSMTSSYSSWRSSLCSSTESLCSPEGSVCDVFWHTHDASSLAEMSIQVAAAPESFLMAATFSSVQKKSFGSWRSQLRKLLVQPGESQLVSCQPTLAPEEPGVWYNPVQRWWVLVTRVWRKAFSAADDTQGSEKWSMATHSS